MPEIVEVKLLTDTLNRLLKNTKIRWHISKNNTRAAKKYKTFWDQVKNKKFKVVRIHQKGKLIIFDLLYNNKPVYICNELRMSGRWSRHPVAKNNHRFFSIRSTGKSKVVWYSDYRGFGTFDYYDNDDDMAARLEERGPDIISDITGPKHFITRMRLKPNWQIVKAIIDQKLTSGVGNWIKSDSLYLAKIDPRSRVKNLSDEDLAKIYRMIKRVINESLKLNGSIGYVGFDGERGGYKFYVYNRKNVKEGKVSKIKFTDSRTTHWVSSMFSKK